jgi:hypothetical protein
VDICHRKSPIIINNTFINRDPAPTEWHGQTLQMHDAHGNPAGTALFPLRLGFLAMVQRREVILREGPFHAFVDRIGILAQDVTQNFLELRRKNL